MNWTLIIIISVVSAFVCFWVGYAIGVWAKGRSIEDLEDDNLVIIVELAAERREVLRD